MSRRRFVVLGVLVLVALATPTAFNLAGTSRGSAPAFAANDVMVVRRGVLVATVSATGAVHPATEASLAFRTSGNVATVWVKPGGTVKAGQPLAKLEDLALKAQLAQAEANVNLAQSKLQQVQKGATDSAVAAAQANLDAANAAYEELIHPNENDVVMARADVDSAQAALNQAQAAYDRIGGASNPQIGMTPQSLQLQNASLAYNKALAAYKSKANPTSAQLKAAQSQIQTAKDQLARLTPLSDQVDQAQASLEAAQAARDLARQRAAEATILAPFDGTITQLDLDSGSFVPAGKNVMTVADLSRFQVTLNIDETDIPRVAVGQTVTLDLDAYSGQSVTARVVEMAPAAVSTQGVVNYAVKIDLPSLEMPIRDGMTANANVEVTRKENVLLIPNRAIRTSGNQRVVTVLENGQPKEVTVNLGLSNAQETEVLSGLAENQQVVSVPVSSGSGGLGIMGGVHGN